MPSQLIEREHDPDSQQSEQLVCPECESDLFWQGAVYFELVCDGCGLVVDEKEIDYGPLPEHVRFTFRAPELFGSLAVGFVLAFDQMTANGQVRVLYWASRSVGVGSA